MTNPPSGLLDRDVSFWLKVALGVATTYMLLQIYHFIGSAFLVAKHAQYLAEGQQSTGSLLDVFPAMYNLVVQVIEVFAAIGTVTGIAMRSTLAGLWGLIKARLFPARAAVQLTSTLLEELQKVLAEQKAKSPPADAS